MRGTIVLAVLGAAGCGRILGVDEYRAGEPNVTACATLLAPDLNGGCSPVGVETCAQGFDKDGRGGCLPILPEGRCGTGASDEQALVATLGGHQCRSIGSGCWAGFPDWPGAGADLRLYVRRDAVSCGDGSSPDTPLCSIREALSKIGSRPAAIALYPGVYEEGPLKIDSPVFITGGCYNTTVVRPAPGAAGPSFVFGPEADK